MDAATKTGIDAAKTMYKRLDQKTAEVIGHLIGNKIADKITSIGKPKEQKKWNFKKLQIFSTQHLMIRIHQDLLLKNGLKSMINQKKLQPSQRNQN